MYVVGRDIKKVHIEKVNVLVTGLVTGYGGRL